MKREYNKWLLSEGFPAVERGGILIKVILRLPVQRGLSINIFSSQSLKDSVDRSPGYTGWCNNGSVSHGQLSSVGWCPGPWWVALVRADWKKAAVAAVTQGSLWDNGLPRIVPSNSQPPGNLLPLCHSQGGQHQEEA